MLRRSVGTGASYSDCNFHRSSRSPQSFLHLGHFFYQVVEIVFEWSDFLQELAQDLIYIEMALSMAALLFRTSLQTVLWSRACLRWA